MKRVLAAFLCLVISIMLVSPARAESDPNLTMNTVYINGIYLLPTQIEGRLLFPLQDALDCAGGRCYPLGDDIVVVAADGTVVTHTVGTDVLVVEGEKQPQSGCSRQLPECLLVPIPFLPVLLGGNVHQEGTAVYINVSAADAPALSDLALLLGHKAFMRDRLFLYTNFWKSRPSASPGEVMAEVNKLMYTETAAFKTYTMAEANRQVAGKGKFLTPGMSEKAFNALMAYRWVRIDDGAPDDGEALGYELGAVLAYDKLAEKIKALGNTSVCKLYDVGKTAQGRTMYSLEVGTGPLVMLFSGGLHANEFFGTEALMKMATDLVTKARTDEATRKLLTQVKFVIIPAANPDGREMVYKERSLATNGSKKFKTNAQGVDLNRNGINAAAAQIKNENKLHYLYSSKPGNYFAGSSLGCAPETKAFIKWFSYYIKEEGAVLYVDFHQQGRMIYTDVDYNLSTNRKHARSFTKAVLDHFNAGNKKTYREVANTKLLVGSGGYLTDTATDIANGFQFGPYGVYGLPIKDGANPLLLFGNMDKVAQSVKPVVPGFITLCIETTLDTRNGEYSYLSGHEREYRDYHFGSLLSLCAQWMQKDAKK